MASLLQSAGQGEKSSVALFIWIECTLAGTYGRGSHVCSVHVTVVMVTTFQWFPASSSSHVHVDVGSALVNVTVRFLS